MSTAPAKGAHVMIQRKGQLLIRLGGGLRPPSEPPPGIGCAGKAGARTPRARGSTCSASAMAMHPVQGQVASQTRPEGGASPRRTWVYVEGWRRPRTWPFELRGE